MFLLANDKLLQNIVNKIINSASTKRTKQTYVVASVKDAKQFSNLASDLVSGLETDLMEFLNNVSNGIHQIKLQDFFYLQGQNSRHSNTSAFYWFCTLLAKKNTHENIKVKIIEVFKKILLKKNLLANNVFKVLLTKPNKESSLRAVNYLSATQFGRQFLNFLYFAILELIKEIGTPIIRNSQKKLEIRTIIPPIFRELSIQLRYFEKTAITYTWLFQTLELLHQEALELNEIDLQLMKDASIKWEPKKFYNDKQLVKIEFIKQPMLSINKYPIEKIEFHFLNNLNCSRISLILHSKVFFLALKIPLKYIAIDYNFHTNSSQNSFSIKLNGNNIEMQDPRGINLDLALDIFKGIGFVSHDFLLIDKLYKELNISKSAHWRFYAKNSNYLSFSRIVDVDIHDLWNRTKKGGFFDIKDFYEGLKTLIIDYSKSNYSLTLIFHSANGGNTFVVLKQILNSLLLITPEMLNIECKVIDEGYKFEQSCVKLCKLDVKMMLYVINSITQFYNIDELVPIICKQFKITKSLNYNEMPWINLTLNSTISLKSNLNAFQKLNVETIRYILNQQIQDDYLFIELSLIKDLNLYSAKVAIGDSTKNRKTITSLCFLLMNSGLAAAIDVYEYDMFGSYIFSLDYVSLLTINEFFHTVNICNDGCGLEIMTKGEEETAFFPDESMSKFTIGMAVYRLIYNEDKRNWQLLRYANDTSSPQSVYITSVLGLNALLRDESHNSADLITVMGKRSAIVKKLTSYEDPTRNDKLEFIDKEICNKYLLNDFSKFEQLDLLIKKYSNVKRSMWIQKVKFLKYNEQGNKYQQDITFVKRTDWEIEEKAIKTALLSVSLLSCGKNDYNFTARLNISTSVFKENMLNKLPGFHYLSNDITVRCFLKSRISGLSDRNFKKSIKNVNSWDNYLSPSFFKPSSTEELFQLKIVTENLDLKQILKNLDSLKKYDCDIESLKSEIRLAYSKESKIASTFFQKVVRPKNKKPKEGEANNVAKLKTNLRRKRDEDNDGDDSENNCSHPIKKRRFN